MGLGGVVLGMLFALPQSLRTLLFVIVRVSKNVS